MFLKTDRSKIIIACTINLLAVSTVFMTQSIFFELSESFRVDITQARFSFSVVSLFYAVFFPLGPAADKFDLPKIAVAGLLLLAITVFYSSYTKSFRLLIITMAFMEVCAALIAFTPDDFYALVTNSGGDSTALVIQVSNDTVIETLNIGLGSANIAVMPDGKKAYAAINNQDLVTVIETPPHLSCVGFEPPMNNPPVTVNGKNRALPIKAQLFDDSGNLITDVDITAAPVIQIIFTASVGGDPVDVSDEALSAGHGTEGNQFEFTDELKWQFNLKTKNYSVPGTYVIKMISGDDLEYKIEPSCETSFVVPE